MELYWEETSSDSKLTDCFSCGIVSSDSELTDCFSCGIVSSDSDLFDVLNTYIISSDLSTWPIEERLNPRSEVKHRSFRGRPGQRLFET